MNNPEKAKQYFKQGYNCAQSVFLTYCENFNIDKITALKLSSSFGAGMGRLREVCGAVSSMFAVLGLKFGYTDSDNDENKTRHYTLIQEASEKFKKEYNTIICRELLGLDEKKSAPTPSKRTKEYYQSRPCENFIETACKIIDEYIDNK